MLTIDDDKCHVMQTSLSEHGYAILVWPKDIPIKWLEHAKEMVVFQLDTMIEGARRLAKREEAANAEYESWFAKEPQS